MKKISKCFTALLLAALLLFSAVPIAGADGLFDTLRDRFEQAETAAQPAPSVSFTAEKTAWTVFLYLCGTDLESEGSAEYACATGNLKDLIKGLSGDQVRFVVQTGGTERWFTPGIDPNYCERFLVQNGAMSKVWQGRRTSMGSSDTLADFLKWGVSAFPAEKTALILWNHGGGSISGVCFDELENDDSLSLREIEAGLKSVSSLLPGGFDVVGFDACLMATLETANILSPYSRYMVASEEVEPGDGWNYRRIGSFLSARPEADGYALGREICDSYYDGIMEEDDNETITMSLVDLRAVPALAAAFDRFAGSMNAKGEDSSVRTMMVRSIFASENFGGNNRSEGYTNMVDLGGLIFSCSPWTDSWREALAAIDSAVIYKRNGDDHWNASGLSLYYPLEVQGSVELSTFADVCPSRNYVAFVDRLVRAATGLTGTSGDVFAQTEALFFNESTGNYEVIDESDTYWDFLDEYDTGGESQWITFAVEPQLDEDGIFFFVLDEDGLDHTESVTALIYQISEDGEDLIELGETMDVDADWDTGTVCDWFDGYWLSLPDGQNLAVYPAYETVKDLVLSAPILLNDEETNLRLRQSWEDGSVRVDGVWAGIDETGYASREVDKLRDGDIIVPLYNALFGDDMEEGYYTGYEYTVKGPLTINYDVMDPGDYLYAFSINDIFGDYYITDPVLFNVDEYGDVSFYEDW